MDTTIKISSEVRDRLAVLAAERGVSMRDLVADFARTTLTHDERQERAVRAEAYLRANVCPDLAKEHLDAAEDFWRSIEAGEVPESLPEPRRKAA